MYERSWRKIAKFLVFLGLSQQLPVAVSTLLLFVAHLHELRYSPASIQSIMSAVSYFHKAHNLFDPTRAFLISKAIIGARNLSQSVDIRLPVTPSVLSKLVASTYHVFVSPYKSLMMRMIMVLAFQAYLRIGEMIPRSKSDVHGCLRLGDVVIVEDVLTVHFRHFKHSAKQGPQTLRVKRTLIDGTNIDPFNILQEFLIARGHVQAPLCSRPDGTPMVRHEFDAALKSLLIFSGLNTSHFKGHSFRIGSATAAAMRGESDAQIRAAGRWSSDAFKRYIRLA